MAIEGLAAAGKPRLKLDLDWRFHRRRGDSGWHDYTVAGVRVGNKYDGVLAVLDAGQVGGRRGSTPDSINGHGQVLRSKGMGLGLGGRGEVELGWGHVVV